MTSPIRAPDEKPSGFGRRFRVAAISVLGGWILRLLGSTWRVRREGGEAFDTMLERKEAFIVVFWHGEIVPVVWVHRRRALAPLISRHADGEIIAHAECSAVFDGERTTSAEADRNEGGGYDAPGVFDDHGARRSGIQTDDQSIAGSIDRGALDIQCSNRAGVLTDVGVSGRHRGRAIQNDR